MLLSSQPTVREDRGHAGTIAGMIWSAEDFAEYCIVALVGGARNGTVLNGTVWGRSFDLGVQIASWLELVCRPKHPGDSPTGIQMRIQHVCMYLYMHTYAPRALLRTHLSACLHRLCICICIYIYIYVHTYIYMCVCVYIYIYIYT